MRTGSTPFQLTGASLRIKSPWHVQCVTPESIEHAVSELRLGRSNKKLVDLCQPHHRARVHNWLPLLQQQCMVQTTLRLATDDGRERFVIYQLCELLGLSYRRIERPGNKTYYCCDFSGPWTDDRTGCGCGNVPKRIRKYETGLDYDDRYTIYDVPWIFKEGVEVTLRPVGLYKFMLLLWYDTPPLNDSVLSHILRYCKQVFRQPVTSQ